MTSLPTSFIESVKHLLPCNDAETLLSALQEEPSVSIRVNSRKWTKAPAFSIAAEPVPWCTSGYYLSTRPGFTFDPLLHAGAYYVQEASSMFLEQAVKTHVHHPLVALDLCAAPGGKSTLLRSLLPDECLLVSNEPMRARAQVLAENLQKWGHPNTVVTQNFPDAFTSFEQTFDCIVCDVPCSGEGMFRKDEVAIQEWSTDNVKLCAQRQKEIITSIWPCLKPGGILIYSTCTFNSEENEENIQWIADTFNAEVLSLSTPKEWGVRGRLGTSEAQQELPVYHFLPGFTRGEGFFMAVLRKPENADGMAEDASCPSIKSTQKGKKRKENKNGQKNKGITPGGIEECKKWLNPSLPFTLETNSKGLLEALPTAHLSLIQQLKDKLYVLQAGVPLAEQKGHDWVPLPGLALNTSYQRGAWPECEISYEQAVAFLRKEAITLPTDAPKGIVCVTYANCPLGFVKNMGNRSNNLYPAEWRIRSSYITPFQLLE